MPLARAGSEHLDALVELNAEFRAAEGHGADPERARDGFGPLLADDRHGSVWLICDDTGSIDGYVVVTWGWSVEIGGAEAVLDEIYVRSRGRGLGGGAVDHVVAECRRRGVRRVFLETERTNEAARRLYARHGFVVDDSIWMSIEPE